VQAERLLELSTFYRALLVDDTVAFWSQHGVDHKHGGFLTFLDRDGSVYGTDKPVWLMGRATWLFATLHQHVEPRPAWLDLARHGYDFLTRFCFDASGKMYFSVTREGQPLQMRRYLYSEVFAVLAYAALAEATGEDALRRSAIALFDRLLHGMRTPGTITPKIDSRTRPMKGLAPVMCLLHVAEQLLRIDAPGRYERLIDELASEVWRDFVKTEQGVILETVAPDGTPLDGPDGRTTNPGHAIETAWFLLETARRRGDAALQEQGLWILDHAFRLGWDAEHGGLLYFVDVEGLPPTQLEHDMKLWWPHSEALYAMLLAYHLSGDVKYASWYEQVHAWTFKHFPDPAHGEWFGYLHRDGSVSTRLKGNMWKGPFHIPRALLNCWKLLTAMTAAA
jgi:N-acylglucosamine 2-epimerase